jgi:hypothetical protein
MIEKSKVLNEISFEKATVELTWKIVTKNNSEGAKITESKAPNV